MSALTQLAREGPRCSVNFSQHVQQQSAVGINVDGLGHVQSTSQSTLKQMDSHLPAICPLQAVLLSSKLPRFFIVKYIFVFGRKWRVFFVFVYFSAEKENLFFRLFYFTAEKVKSIFGRPLKWYKQQCEGWWQNARSLLCCCSLTVLGTYSCGREWQQGVVVAANKSIVVEKKHRRAVVRAARKILWGGAHGL